jgi:cysteinyl-tRNA synthetase
VPYRKKLNFTFDGLKAAATAIERLRNYQLRLQTEKFESGLNEAVEKRSETALQRLEESLDDDLNVAEALGAVFEYIRDMNSAMDSREFRSENLSGACRLLERFDYVFDILKPSQAAGAITDSEVERLIAERQQARKTKNFKRSDEIRDELFARGVVLEDTKDGVRWKRK